MRMRLVEASWLEGLAVRESGSCSDMLSKSLTFYWWVGLCSLPVVGLRPSCGRGNGNLLPSGLCQDCCIQCPWPHNSHVDPCLPGDSWTLTGKSASVSCEGHCPFLLAPSVHKVLFVPSKSLSHQSHGSYVIKSHWPSRENSLRVLSPFAGPPCWEVFCGP